MSSPNTPSDPESKNYFLLPNKIKVTGDEITLRELGLNASDLPRKIRIETLLSIPHPETGGTIFGDKSKTAEDKTVYLTIKPFNPPITKKNIQDLIKDKLNNPEGDTEKTIQTGLGKLEEMIGTPSLMKMINDLELKTYNYRFKNCHPTSLDTLDLELAAEIMRNLFVRTHEKTIIKVYKDGTEDNHEIALAKKYEQLHNLDKYTALEKNKSVAQLAIDFEKSIEDAERQYQLRKKAKSVFEHPDFSGEIPRKGDPQIRKKSLKLLGKMEIPYQPSDQERGLPSPERVMLEQLQYGRMMIAERIPMGASKEELIATLETRIENTQKTLDFLNEKKLGGPRLHSALHRIIEEATLRKKMCEEDTPYLLKNRPYAGHMVPTTPVPGFWMELDPRQPLETSENDYLNGINHILSERLSKYLTLVSNAKTAEELKTNLDVLLLLILQFNIQTDVDIPWEKWAQKFPENERIMREKIKAGNIKRPSFTGSERFHLDNDVVLFHLFTGAHQIVGHPERDPMNREDRDKTIQEIEKNHPQVYALLNALSPLIQAPQEYANGPGKTTTVTDNLWWYEQTFKAEAGASLEHNVIIPGLRPLNQTTDIHQYTSLVWAEGPGQTDPQIIQLIETLQAELAEFGFLSDKNDIDPKKGFDGRFLELIHNIEELKKHVKITGIKWPREILKTYKEIRKVASEKGERKLSRINFDTLNLKSETTLHFDEKVLYYHLLNNISKCFSNGSADLMNQEERTALRQTLEEDPLENENPIEILKEADRIFETHQGNQGNIEWYINTMRTLKEISTILLTELEQCRIPETEDYRVALQKNLEDLITKIEYLRNGDRRATFNQGDFIIFPEGTQSIESMGGIWAKPTEKKGKEDANALGSAITKLNNILKINETGSLGEIIAETVNTVCSLQDVRGACKLKGIEWKHTLPKGDGLSKMGEIFPQSSVHVSETIFAYRLIKKLNAATGNPERDPLKKSDRDTTWEEIHVLAEKEIGEAAELMKSTPDKIVAALKEIFEQADRLFPSEFPDFKRIEAFANANFAEQGKPKKKRGKSRLDDLHTTTTTEADIQASIEACRKWAVYVPHDLKGFIPNLDEIRTCSKITKCYIEHENPEGIVFPPNLKCHGHFEVEFGKITHVLNWHLTPSAEIILQIDGKNYGAAAFQDGNLKTFYLELKRIVLKGLEGRLIRDFNLMETESVRHLTGGRIARTMQLPGKGGESVMIRPRVDKLFQGGGKRKERTEEEPTAPRMAQRVKKALEYLKDGTPVKKEYLAPLTLYVKKTHRLSNGHDVDLFIPGNTAEILMAIHNGDYPLEDVYLNTLTRGFAKAGYGVKTEELLDGKLVRVCKPKQQSDEAKERYDALKKELGIELSAEGLQNRTEITIPLDVEAVILQAPEDLPEAVPTRVALTEILEFLDAAESGETPTHDVIEAIEAEAPNAETIAALSEGPDAIDALQAYTRSRLRRVAFHAPQNPQFRQGSFVSLDQALNALDETATDDDDEKTK